VKDVAALEELQDLLYAQGRTSLLIVLQAMDAAGKDSVVKHVMSGVNPQGVTVTSFKSPSSFELDHDFLWRHVLALPRRGMIGIFNRSYYEEALVVRVHPEFLANERLPKDETSGNIWKHRFEDINNFERYLSRNGTAVVKFFLHVSQKEQRKRFLARLQDPEKHWKFSSADLKERARWKEYMEAYEDVISNTSTEWAPWYVIPADHKWFTRAAVADILVQTMKDLKLSVPEVSEEKEKEFAEAARTLEAGE
jgi:PPK2 family polyphosphate:nucleotide phosphotransferase